MTASITPSPTSSFVARDPVDVLAVVPVVLGFEPTESLVLLTFGSARQFHARVDLPRTAEERSEVVSALLEPARRHRVPRVLLVGYAADHRRAAKVVRAATRRFERAGIDVLDALCADGRRWYAAQPRPGVPDQGVPYDLSGHRFAAQAVVEGHVVHRSREHLRDSIEPDASRVAQVVAALAALTAAPQAAAEASWARAFVSRHARTGTCPGDAEVARLLRAILDPAVRNAAGAGLTRVSGPGHVAFWTDVLRRTPPPMAAAPAALLGVAAWQAGHGALAWCAVERALEAEPGHALATLVAQLLEQAVPPDVL